MHLLREPLCHFLILGALLFVLHSLTRDRVEALPNTLTVSAAQVSLLQEQWMQQWQRPATPKELQTLIDQYIRDEILYREAKALGLDHDDTIIRRRLVQKIDFLFADAVTLAEPSREELQAFFIAHPDQYQTPEKRSFTHIYFNPDQRPRIRSDAERVLQVLQTTAPLLRAPEKGDTFALSYDYTQKTVAEVTREFGEAFAQQLFALTPGHWQGPLESGYGLHLVRIHEHLAATAAPFDEVGERVREDFRAVKRREANELAYQRFRERYVVVIEHASDSAAVALQFREAQ